ncbi:hypothetical protein MC7420_2509 [Coleofasciculus chthonoplastes PCC 7420]|uniref:Uncharacterized protein n=2 Tax=Coleofasciculus chthonoplastes TaxID=64178 RepID=B4VZM1_9CYAN|nr:hypothetical protein MC7420_2509 [Coleofasciculus chthonoplastes PCC 7420]
MNQHRQLTNYGVIETNNRMMRQKLSLSRLRTLFNTYQTIRKNSQNPDFVLLKTIYSGRFQFGDLVSPNVMNHTGSDLPFIQDL